MFSDSILYQDNEEDMKVTDADGPKDCCPPLIAKAGSNSAYNLVSSCASARPSTSCRTAFSMAVWAASDRS